MDMSTAEPDDLAAAYGDVPERMTQEALEHVWIHTRDYVELAEQRGMRVFDHGKDEFLYDL